MQFQFQTTPKRRRKRNDPHAAAAYQDISGSSWTQFGADIRQSCSYLCGDPESESKQCVKLESHGRIWTQKQRACRRRRWRDSGHFSHLCGISLDFGVDRNARHACYGVPPKIGATVLGSKYKIVASIKMKQIYHYQGSQILLHLGFVVERSQCKISVNKSKCKRT